MNIKLIITIKNKFLKLRTFLFYNLLALISNYYILESLKSVPTIENEAYTDIMISLSCFSLFIILTLYSLYTYLVSKHWSK